MDDITDSISAVVNTLQVEGSTHQAVVNNREIEGNTHQDDEYEDMTEEFEEFLETEADNYWRSMTRIENKVEEGFLWFIGNRHHGNRGEALANRGKGRVPPDVTGTPLRGHRGPAGRTGEFRGPPLKSANQMLIFLIGLWKDGGLKMTPLTAAGSSSCRS